MSHICHAEGCDVPVPRKMFMCRTHWFKVPKIDRDLIWTLYTPGQERNMDLVTPEYLEEAMRIIRELAASEATE